MNVNISVCIQVDVRDSVHVCLAALCINCILKLNSKEFKKWLVPIGHINAEMSDDNKDGGAVIILYCLWIYF